MKRFVFTLATVLKFKRHRKWLAEARQQQAAAALQTAQAMVQGITGQLNQVNVGLQSKMGKPQNPTTWLAVYRQFDLLEQALHLARQKVERAAEEYDNAALHRKQALAEVEALLTLRRRQWQEYRAAVQRAEQELLDEIGLRRWLVGSRENQETPP